MLAGPRAPLHLTDGLAGSAEGYCLLAEVPQFNMSLTHIRMPGRGYDFLSGGTLNLGVDCAKLWLVEVKQLL